MNKNIGLFVFLFHLNKPIFIKFLSNSKMYDFEVLFNFKLSDASDIICYVFHEKNVTNCKYFDE